MLTAVEHAGPVRNAIFGEVAILPRPSPVRGGIFVETTSPK